MERNLPPGLMMMAIKVRENMPLMTIHMAVGPPFDSFSYLALLLSACRVYHLAPSSFPNYLSYFFLPPSLCWAAGPLSGVRLMIRIAGQQFHPLRLLTLLNFLPIYTSLAYSVTCYMLSTKWSITGYMLYILPIIHMQLFGLLYILPAICFILPASLQATY